MRLTKPAFAVVAGLSLCLLSPAVSYANEVGQAPAASSQAASSQEEGQAPSQEQGAATQKETGTKVTSGPAKGEAAKKAVSGTAEKDTSKQTGQSVQLAGEDTSNQKMQTPKPAAMPRRAPSATLATTTAATASATTTADTASATTSAAPKRAAAPKKMPAATASVTTSAAPKLAAAPKKAPAATATTSASLVNGGVYELQYAQSTGKRLEVSGGSTSNGGRVQTWQDNTTAAQRWRAIASGGYYRFQNVNSGKYLDVPGANAYQGASLQQYSGNGTKAQLWKVVADSRRSGYYVLQSALNTRMVLDISGAYTGNGGTAQLWSANGTAAQSFRFIRLTAPVSDGVYSLANVGSGKVLDVSGASLSDSGNVQQYQSNGTTAQRYYLHYNSSTGYYTVTNVQSGKVLDVSGGNSYNGANVQQYSSNGTRAQLWTIKASGSGSYTLASAIDGRVLDVSGGSKANSANVQLWGYNGTGAQRWQLASQASWLTDGTYQVVSTINTANDISLPYANNSTDTAVRTYPRNSKDTYNKWQLVSSGGGYWRLINLGTGRALTAAYGAKNGSWLKATDYTGASSQLFKVVMTTTGIKFASRLNGNYAIDINGGSGSAGATVQLYQDNGTRAQRFCLVPTALYETNTSYCIRSANGSATSLGLSVDVPSASTADGVGLQVYSNNGSAAQSFMFKDAGNGYVRIISGSSGKYINEVNARPTQQASASTLWKVTFDADVNALRVTSSSGRSFTLGGSTAGTPITLAGAASGNRGQAFVLCAKSIRSSYRLNGYDISHWQVGMNLARVASDFVICKATEGTTYLDPSMKTFADQSLALGRGLALYHFVSANSTPEAQANYFVKTVQGYLGKAVLVLDWENGQRSDGSVYSNALPKGPSFAKRFLDAVYKQTGVRPLVYTSKGVVNQYNWTSVANSGYKLWVAQYPNYKTVNGYQKDPWTDSRGYGAFGEPIMFQYTSTGHLSGYGNNLDLDLFYGSRSDWDALARR